MDSLILVQILGAVTLIISVSSMQQRKKETLLIFQTASCCLFILQYIITDSIAGAVAFFIAIVRNIIFYFYKVKGRKPSLAILIIFEVIVVISTALSWKNLLSLIPLIATTTNTWGLWQNDMKWTRRTALIAQGAWCIYDFTAIMYTAVMTEAFNLASTLIAIWRLDIRKNSRKTP